MAPDDDSDDFAAPVKTDAELQAWHDSLPGGENSELRQLVAEAQCMRWVARQLLFRLREAGGYPRGSEADDPLKTAVWLVEIREPKRTPAAGHRTVARGADGLRPPLAALVQSISRYSRSEPPFDLIGTFSLLLAALDNLRADWSDKAIRDSDLDDLTSAATAEQASALLALAERLRSADDAG